MKIQNLLFMLLILLPGTRALSQVTVQDWDVLALRLSAESTASYERTIAKLRLVPQLETKLRAGLRGNKRYLAMDVISALQLTNLLPELVAGAEKDETGFFLNAINSLLNSRNVKFVSDLYRHRVFDSGSPPAARAVMLDTLGRLGTPLNVARLIALVDEDPSPDVKSAALYYARLMILRRARDDYLPVVTSGLRAQPFQLRVQALFLASELGPAVRTRLSVNCAQDRNKEVRDVCRELFPSGGRAR
jgi:hypothetical protein